MTSAQQPDNAINLLRELNIPGRTKVPVSTNPDVWGLNIAAVLDNFPRHGLQCLAGPWGTMGVGDRLVIFRGSGNQVLQETVDENEVGKALTMFVESRHLGEGPHDISYAVTRLGQIAEPSEIMKVLVKLTRPGGHDDNDEAGHSKLIMLIAREILDGGIDQGNVADGVDITIERYPGIAAGDVIRLSWGGVSVFSPPLTQDQADGKTPIIIHVNEATIREAGDSGEKGLAVVFEVYDVVDNRSEDWSAAQWVVVTIDQKRPIAPLLKEALNNILDVDKLGDANGTGQVIALDDQFFTVGDIIFVRVRGTPVEGAPIDEELPGKLLESVPSIPEITIPNVLLRRLAKTQMVLSYRIQKADGSAGFLSKGQFISVIGEVQRLKPPIAEDARQGALDPDLPRTRIEIPFDPSFEAGQVIKLFWLGTLPDFTPYLPDLPLRPITQGDIDAELPLYITVDAAHIKPLVGGTLELYYQLWIEDSVLATLDRYTALHAIRESEHASLLNVGEPRQELPEPIVDGVLDGVLDPDRNGTTLTATWLNTLDKDEVIREWEGSKTGLSSDSILLNSFTAGRPIPFDINAALIKGNHGGTVSARYSVVRTGERPRYSHPLKFSVGVALELDPPTIQQAEPDGTTLQPIKAVDALTAIIASTGLLLTDLLSVTWTGATGTAAGGSHTTVARPISEIGLSIALPVTVLAFSLNKSVTVTFTITRDGKPTNSLPLILNVQSLPQSELPKPWILVADNDGEGPEINVSNLTANTATRIGVWPLIASGQRAWMRLRGTKTDGSAYLNNVAPGSAVGQLWIDNGYQNRGLTLADLRSLKDGSTLTIECKATLNTSTNENEALVFPVRTYTIKAFEVVTPTITRAEDSKNVEIPQGGITADTAVTLTGTASKGQKVQIFDGTTSKGEATAHLTSGIWTLVMTGLSLAAHSFTAKALYGAGQTSEPRTLTIQEANIPTFTNPPYVIAPAGRFKNIELVLRNGSTPVSGKIALTLPADFTYADGGSGTREFMTDANGLLSVSGIKGHTRPGAYTLTADSGFASATANMTITPQGGVGTIPTGSGAYGVAVSPDGTRVYACNSQTHTISVMDVITRTVIATIPVGDYPYGIAVSPDGTSAYVGSVMSNAVSVIDTVNLLVTKAIPVGSGSSWIVVSPDGTRAYASSTGGVSVIDTVNLAIIGTISLPVVGGIAVSPDGTRAYACSTGGVSVIDTVNLVVTWTIPTGTRPYWIAISPDGTRAYVSHSVANTVSVIDIVNLVMIRTISNVAYTQLISVSPDGTRAYVCNWRGDTVSVIDTVTFMVIRTIPVGANPVGIAVNPDGTRAYVGNQSSNFVSVIAVG